MVRRLRCCCSTRSWPPRRGHTTQLATHQKILKPRCCSGTSPVSATGFSSAGGASTETATCGAASAGVTAQQQVGAPTHRPTARSTTRVPLESVEVDSVLVPTRRGVPPPERAGH